MTELARARRFMVDNQIRTFDVTDRALIAVFDDVPREAFLPGDLGTLAYADRPQPCGVTAEGEARMAVEPMLLARMIQSLAPRLDDRVLVLPAAGAYAAAVLARMSAHVTLLEPDAGLADTARGLLTRAGVTNAEVLSGPLDGGSLPGGNYDAILIEGAYELRPEALLARLAEGGRLATLDASSGPQKAVTFVAAGGRASARRIVGGTGAVLPAFRRTSEFAF